MAAIACVPAAHLPAVELGARFKTLRTAQLRVKVKHLCAEARIIKADVRKYARIGTRALARGRVVTWDSGHPLQTMWSLENHRRQVLRPAARVTHLAACALRGTSYARCESKTIAPPSLENVEKEALRFGPVWPESVKRGGEFGEIVQAWLADARAYIEGQGFSWDEKSKCWRETKKSS